MPSAGGHRGGASVSTPQDLLAEPVDHVTAGSAARRTEGSLCALAREGSPHCATASFAPPSSAVVSAVPVRRRTRQRAGTIPPGVRGVAPHACRGERPLAGFCPSTGGNMRKTVKLSAIAAMTALVMVDVSMGTAHASPGDWQLHTPYASNMCLDAAYAPGDPRQDPSKNGDKVQMWVCNGQAQQGWIFHPRPYPQWRTRVHHHQPAQRPVSGHGHQRWHLPQHLQRLQGTRGPAVSLRQPEAAGQKAGVTGLRGAHAGRGRWSAV